MLGSLVAAAALGLAVKLLGDRSSRLVAVAEDERAEPSPAACERGPNQQLALAHARRSTGRLDVVAIATHRTWVELSLGRWPFVVNA